jgi:hypothetical protein
MVDVFDLVGLLKALLLGKGFTIEAVKILLYCSVIEVYRLFYDDGSYTIFIDL